jgi:hypothetical protein
MLDERVSSVPSMRFSAPAKPTRRAFVPVAEPPDHLLERAGFGGGDAVVMQIKA